MPGMERPWTHDIVILGGGIAGLAFALKAPGRGKRVVVLESNSQVGGLARTMLSAVCAINWPAGPRCTWPGARARFAI